jgi:hypothetical protein
MDRKGKSLAAHEKFFTFHGFDICSTNTCLEVSK